MKHSQNGNGRIGVGSIVVARRDRRVRGRRTRRCYEVYTLDNRPGYSFIFEGGRYDGFSPDEVATMLRWLRGVLASRGQALFLIWNKSTASGGETPKGSAVSGVHLIPR